MLPGVSEWAPVLEHFPGRRFYCAVRSLSCCVSKHCHSEAFLNSSTGAHRLSTILESALSAEYTSKKFRQIAKNVEQNRTWAQAPAWTVPIFAELTCHVQGDGTLKKKEYLFLPSNISRGEFRPRTDTSES